MQPPRRDQYRQAGPGSLRDNEGACDRRRFPPAPYADDYVRHTVAALKEMDVDYVIPLHCSGEVFYELTKSEIPTKLLRSYTGTRFVFEGHAA